MWKHFKKDLKVKKCFYSKRIGRSLKNKRNKNEHTHLFNASLFILIIHTITLNRNSTLATFSYFYQKKIVKQKYFSVFIDILQATEHWILTLKKYLKDKPVLKKKTFFYTMFSI